MSDLDELFPGRLAERAHRLFVAGDLEHLSADEASVSPDRGPRLHRDRFEYGRGARVGDVRVLCDVAAEGHEIVLREPVYRIMTGDPREGLELLEGYVQEIGDPARGGVCLEALAELGLLRGNADGALAGAADAVLLAGRGDQRRSLYRQEE